jgi:hypothetical protein
MCSLIASYIQFAQFTMCIVYNSTGIIYMFKEYTIKCGGLTDSVQFLK